MFWAERLAIAWLAFAGVLYGLTLGLLARIWPYSAVLMLSVGAISVNQLLEFLVSLAVILLLVVTVFKRRTSNDYQALKWHWIAWVFAVIVTIGGCGWWTNRRNLDMEQAVEMLVKIPNPIVQANETAIYYDITGDPRLALAIELGMAYSNHTASIAQYFDIGSWASTLHLTSDETWADVHLLETSDRNNNLIDAASALVGLEEFHSTTFVLRIVLRLPTTHVRPRILAFFQALNTKARVPRAIASQLSTTQQVGANVLIAWSYILHSLGDQTTSLKLSQRAFESYPNLDTLEYLLETDLASHQYAPALKLARAYPFPYTWMRTYWEATIYYAEENHCQLLKRVARLALIQMPKTYQNFGPLNEMQTDLEACIP